MNDPDWPARLRCASDALSAQPGVPDWLKTAVRDALSVADDLAPREDAEPAPSDSLYPH